MTTLISAFTAASRRARRFTNIAGLIALALTAAGASAQAQMGTIVGVVRDPVKLPVAGATMIAVKEGGGAIRSTVSGSDGVYTFPDLAPGTYTVKARTQSYPEFVVSSLKVLADDATRTDISLTPPAKIAVAPAVISTAAPPAPSAVTPPAPSTATASPAPSATTPPASPSASSGPIAASQVPGAGTTTVAPHFWPRLTREIVSRPQPVNVASLAPPPAGAFDRPAASPYPLPSIPTPQGGPSAPAPGPQGPEPAAAPAATDTVTPFADYDWTWLNGNTRQHDSPLDSKYFSGEFRADTFYGIDFNQPTDHSMGGSSEVFRNGEVQLEDLSIGGDFHAGQMRGRVLMLYGMFSSTTVRNDASPAVGQWDVRAAYKYVSEAYGGYHFNVQHGLNIDAGIFVSYVGLFSYHNFDNWAYQPSYVSSNTPWFFNGVRIQWFPTNHLKIEPWFINGWQSYNKFNSHPGLGGQLKWTPNSAITVIANQYGFGEDNLGLQNRQRYHTDDSLEVKYYDNPAAGKGIDRMAFTFTGDAGCESGDGVTCHGGKAGPRQDFLGWMAYNRWWWHHDLYGLTLGGGQMDNPGRYLTLVLPINGADAISGTPYFPAAPGLQLHAYDATATFDWMPSQFVTFRAEVGYRHTSVPYWSGRHGITPPGGNNGSPADYVCMSGLSSGATDLASAEAACGGGRSSVWFPDLREGQALLNFAILVKL